MQALPMQALPIDACLGSRGGPRRRCRRSTFSCGRAGSGCRWSPEPRPRATFANGGKPGRRRRSTALRCSPTRGCSSWQWSRYTSPARSPRAFVAVRTRATRVRLGEPPRSEAFSAQRCSFMEPAGSSSSRRDGGRSAPRPPRGTAIVMKVLPRQRSAHQQARLRTETADPGTQRSR